MVIIITIVIIYGPESKLSILVGTINNNPNKVDMTMSTLRSVVSETPRVVGARWCFSTCLGQQQVSWMAQYKTSWVDGHCKLCHGETWNRLESPMQSLPHVFICFVILMFQPVETQKLPASELRFFSGFGQHSLLQVRWVKIPCLRDETYRIRYHAARRR